MKNLSNPTPATAFLMSRTAFIIIIVLTALAFPSPRVFGQDAEDNQKPTKTEKIVGKGRIIKFTAQPKKPKKRYSSFAKIGITLTGFIAFIFIINKSRKRRQGSKLADSDNRASQSGLYRIDANDGSFRKMKLPEDIVGIIRSTEIIGMMLKAPPFNSLFKGDSTTVCKALLFLLYGKGFQAPDDQEKKRIPYKLVRLMEKIAVFEKVAQPLELSSDSQKTNQLFQAIQTAKDELKYHEIVALVSNFEADFPTIDKKDHAKMAFVQAEALLLLGEGKEAKTPYQKAVQLDNNEPLYHSRLGEYFTSSKSFESAFNSYQTAFNLIGESIAGNHEKKVQAHLDLALAYQNRENYEEAIRFFEKALRLQIELDDKDLRRVADCRDGLGEAYRFNGDYEKAHGCYLKAAQDHEAVSDIVHPGIAAVYYNTANLFSGDYKFDRALGCYETAQEILVPLYGDYHPKLAAVYMGFGTLYCRMEQETGEDYLDDCADNYLKAIEIYNLLFGKADPKTASAHKALAEAYRTLEEYDKALNAFLDALESYTALGDDFRLECASIYTSLACLRAVFEQHDQADDNLSKALDIYRQTGEKNHPEIAAAYRKLAYEYSKSEDFDKAKTFFDKALEKTLELYGPKHAKTALIYNDIGGLLSKGKLYDQALEPYQKSLEIQNQMDNADLENKAKTNSNIGLTFFMVEKYAKALEHLEEALKLLQLFHPLEVQNIPEIELEDVAEVKRNIAIVKEKMMQEDA